jgi:hypothetical protein
MSPNGCLGGTAGQKAFVPTGEAVWCVTTGVLLVARLGPVVSLSWDGRPAAGGGVAQSEHGKPGQIGGGGE